MKSASQVNDAYRTDMRVTRHPSIPSAGQDTEDNIQQNCLAATARKIDRVYLLDVNHFPTCKVIAHTAASRGVIGLC